MCVCVTPCHRAQIEQLAAANHAFMVRNTELEAASHDIRTQHEGVLEWSRDILIRNRQLEEQTVVLECRLRESERGRDELEAAKAQLAQQLGDQRRETVVQSECATVERERSETIKAELVETLAKLKGADERRRQEKRDLANQLRIDLEASCWATADALSRCARLEAAIPAEQQKAADALAQCATLSKIAEDHSKCQHLASELEYERTDARKLRAELQTLRKKRDRDVETRNHTKAELKELSGEMDKLKETHSKLRTRCKKLLDANRDLRVELGQAELEKQAAQTEAKAIDRSYEDMARESEQIALQLGGAREHILDLEQQILVLHSVVVVMAHQINDTDLVEKLLNEVHLAGKKNKLGTL